MKIILWILAGLVGIGILAVGSFLWLAMRTESRVGGAAKALEKEFSSGASIAALPGRALNLGAGSFELYVSDPTDSSKQVSVANADRTFPEIQSGEKFDVQYPKFEAKFQETPTGWLVLTFPVFMNSRWVLKVQFENGRVKTTETTYLD